MKNDFEKYEAICDEELAAADRTTSEQARVAHLERALRNALLAARMRPESWRRGLVIKNTKGERTPTA